MKRASPLDQHALLRRHPAHVFPPVVLVPLHAERLPVAVRVLERVRDEVARAVDAVEVAERERPVERDVVDRPPQIYDLEAPLEQPLHILGREVAMHARDGRRGRLVDVHARDGLPILRRVVGDSRAPAADGYAEMDTMGTRRLTYRASTHFQEQTHCGRIGRHGWRP